MSELRACWDSCSLCGGKKGKTICARLFAGVCGTVNVHSSSRHKLQPSSCWNNVVALGCKSNCAQTFAVPSSLSGGCVFHFHCQLYTVHSALLIAPALVRLSPCPIITPAAAATKAGEFDLTWSIFYCSVFNTFLKILSTSSMKTMEAEKTHCLVYFKCFSWCGGGRWLEGDTHLQLSHYRRQEGIIRGGWREG